MNVWISWCHHITIGQWIQAIPSYNCLFEKYIKRNSKASPSSTGCFSLSVQRPKHRMFTPWNRTSVLSHQKVYLVYWSLLLHPEIEQRFFFSAEMTRRYNNYSQECHFGHQIAFLGSISVLNRHLSPYLNQSPKSKTSFLPFWFPLLPWQNYPKGV